MPYSQGHGLDSVMEMVATAVGTTALDVVGIIGTVASPSVQNAAMKVQWYGPLPSLHLSPCQPFLLIASTSSTRQTCRPSPNRIYTSLASNASSRSATASQGTRFPSTTPCSPEAPTGLPEPVRAPGPFDPSTLPESAPARVGLQTVRAMLDAGWPAPLAALSSFSPPSFPTPFLAMSSALQALAQIAGCLALHTPRDAFFVALAKAVFPPRVVSVLDESPQAQRHALPFHWRGSRWASQAAV